MFTDLRNVGKMYSHEAFSEFLTYEIGLYLNIYDYKKGSVIPAMIRQWLQYVPQIEESSLDIESYSLLYGIKQYLKRHGNTYSKHSGAYELSRDEALQAKINMIPKAIEPILPLYGATESLESKIRTVKELFAKYTSLKKVIGNEVKVVNLWAEALYNLALAIDRDTSVKGDDAYAKRMAIRKRCLSEMPKHSHFYFRAMSLYVRNAYNLYYNKATKELDSKNPQQYAHNQIESIYHKVNRNAIKAEMNAGLTGVDQSEQSAIEGIRAFMQQAQGAVQV